MRKKWKNEFDKIRVKEAEYDYVMDEICDNNRNLIIILGSISAVIFAFLILLGIFRIGVEAKDIPVFCLAFSYAVGILILMQFTPKENHTATMIATYLTMGAVVFYGLLISYRSPEHYTVTFIAMMGIMSMTFVDKPVRIGAAHILVTIVCVCMVWVHKSESIKVADLINILSFSILSFIGGFFTVNMKVHGYMMDRLQEEDIAKGRQRLNEKEIEALQLLTAIKLNYDMIVCVNLSKNTYKLVGEESFVTQGDSIEGNFDDVIEIHAAKVVPEHRKNYLDTFTRQGLLKAHAEGKKEVYLEYQQCDEKGIPHWLSTHTMFIDDIHSDDITEITISQNIDERVRKEEEIKAVLEREQELENQYAKTSERHKFLETMAANLPGGYHRCTTDHNFRLTFISKSFTQVTGYTMEQIEEELDCSYVGIVAPEDRAFFMSMAPQLERDGYIQCAYRMRRRDGSIRWVQDSTQYIERDGEKYYQCALTDITEQIEALERAKHEAEASNQAKSTFLFNISHDIRTPMNAIKGFAGIIKEHKDDPELVGETIEKIELASNTLMTLMNDVLDLSRIERGKEELNLEPIHMHEYEQGLVEMFAVEMQEAGINFVIDTNISHSHVMCDPLKLARIGMNMLSNAKKFTAPGGTVTFGIEETDCDENAVTYRIYTKDTGVGMSKEFLKRAFEQFERERTATESRVNGSGLGLAIIKRFVELMGGTIELQSELGKGTEIAAIIPLPLVKDIQDHIQEQPSQNPDLSGKRVLLVEDNDFNREIGRYILEGMQFTVEEAENGAACIDKLMSAENGYYDLILMDIQMPVMDGYTATMEIRNLSDVQKANIPIVAMTANAFEEDKRKCFEVGMNGHIGKPIELDILTEVLIKVFR